ncbi:MAG: ABC transporter permease [Clostridia bacterium]|jgi:ABC-type dipeptide/oligopeptide/nickel transport system permease subunit|nr:ABC transporter permease [Clostridia bacterium]
MLRKNYNIWIGLGLITFMGSLSLISLFYTPFDPHAMHMDARFLKPSATFLLGTDQFGRDILSRIMAGGRIAFLISLLAVIFGSLVGFLLGSIAGLGKGFIGQIIMRFIDGLMAFPGILLALMLVTILGRGQHSVVIAIGVFNIPIFARLVYGLILGNENKLYLKAAESFGASKIYILFKHMVPAILPRFMTQFSSSVGVAILTESSLSFLGLGVQPPNPSWGIMLSEASQYIMTNYYLPIVPGLAIMLTVLGFNLLGDGINDMLVKRGSEL